MRLDQKKFKGNRNIPLQNYKFYLFVFQLLCNLKNMARTISDMKYHSMELCINVINRL